MGVEGRARDSFCFRSEAQRSKGAWAMAEAGFNGRDLCQGLARKHVGVFVVFG